MCVDVCTDRVHWLCVDMLTAHMCVMMCPQEPGEGEEEAVGSKRGRPTYRFMHWFMDEELEAGQHDELADIIKDDVWPKPLEYFMGHALEDDEVRVGQVTARLLGVVDYNHKVCHATYLLLNSHVDRSLDVCTWGCFRISVCHGRFK